VAALAACLTVGCDRLQPAEEGEGADAPFAVVVDPQAVADALGRRQVLEEQVAQTEQQLRSQVAQIAQALESRLQEEREKLGEELTEKELAELSAKVEDAQARLRQAQRLAQARSRTYRTSLRQQFWEELRPVAAGLARERGASLVLMVTDAVLWFDPEEDITDEVIAVMRARRATGPEGDAQERGAQAPPDDPEGSEQARPQPAQ